MDAAKRDEAFRKRLLATFKVEAEEHLRVMSSGLIDLEKAPPAEQWREIIEAIYRETHSLKGAARSTNLTDIEAICQVLESIFAALKRQEMALSMEQFDLLHQAMDRTAELVLSAKAEPTPAENSDIRALIQDLQRIRKGGTLEPKQKKEPQAEATYPSVPESQAHPPIEKTVLAEERLRSAETVRIATTKLDTLLLQAEELIGTKLTIGQRVAELREIGDTLAAWKMEWSKLQPEVRAIQGSIERNNQGNGHSPRSDPQEKGNAGMLKVLEFLEKNEAHLKTMENRLASLTRATAREQHTLGRMVDGLLKDMKQVVMLPVSSLLEIFPKLVRDLSRDQGKEVELVMRGQEIEIDKRILAEMKDPLIHLVRNCVDHGIEKPQERAQKQKPTRGLIVIAFESKNSNQVEIRISDDGVGVDLAAVRAAALKSGHRSPEEVASRGQQETVSLIFESGVSTSPIITNLSGRGLGLAIVHERVEKLGGTISVETGPAGGTTLRIVLPLTLATFRGVIVGVAGRPFVLPTLYVERVVSVRTADVKTVENRETIQLKGQILSLLRLAEVLELPQAGATDDTVEVIKVVILTAAERSLAFRVDEVLGEQEVLVKSLGPQLTRVRNVAGATILGTGKVAPILNVPDLMKSAARASDGIRKLPTVPAQQGEPRRKPILVAEDSITARMLLKNILEAAGYLVATAVDGVDAITQLRSGEYELVVSDVDMPRMNGLDLTATIRGDKKLARLPVVLVTALGSREDRERGIDVGANAYIVKSSFDQSNLLAVIRKLIARCINC